MGGWESNWEESVGPNSERKPGSLSTLRSKHGMAASAYSEAPSGHILFTAFLSQAITSANTCSTCQSACLCLCQCEIQLVIRHFNYTWRHRFTVRSLPQLFALALPLYSPWQRHQPLKLSGELAMDSIADSPTCHNMSTPTA